MTTERETLARELAREIAADERKYMEFIDPDGIHDYQKLTPEERYNNTWSVGAYCFLEEAQDIIDRQEQEIIDRQEQEIMESQLLADDEN
jgi:hypothetical protein